MNIGNFDDMDEIDSETRNELAFQKKKLEDKIKKQENPVQKVVMNAIKTVVVTMLVKILPILLGSITLIVLFAGFQSILDDDGKTKTNPDEELESTLSQTGGLDITSDTWQLSKSELEDYINNYDTTNEDLREEMPNRIDEIYDWQNNYEYSGAVLITIAFEEDIPADDFDNFLNEMSTNAQKWKDEGYTTIPQIAEDYVGDDTAEEWANNIENNIKDTGMDSGIIETGQEQVMSGDGYPNVYVSKSGKMYRNYKQNIGSYSTKQWCGTSIVKNDGCSLIAVTIIISGYQDREVDPLVIAQQYAIRGSGMNIPGALSGNGISWSQPFGESNNKSTQFTNDEKQKIKDHLATGSPAIIKVVPPSQFTDSTHFMALLDYNEATDEVYLSNPYTGNNSYGATGWIDADIVLYYCTRFYAIR